MYFQLLCLIITEKGFSRKNLRNFDSINQILITLNYGLIIPSEQFLRKHSTPVQHSHDTWVYLYGLFGLPSSIMRTTSEFDIEIAKVVEDIYMPNPDDQQRYPSDLQVTSDRFEALIDDVQKIVPPPRQARYAESHRSHLSNILLNFARSVVTKRWTVLFKEAKKYSPTGLMHYAGFTSPSRTNHILESLERAEEITKVDGSKYETNSNGNLYYPNRELRKHIYKYGLEASSQTSFDKVLIRINQATKVWRKQDLRHIEDYEKIFEINEYARDQEWACKEAIIRIFRHNPFSAGRLYTEFQNLPNRAHQIRRNTLINDEPITEVNFNANQFRIFLAFNNEDVFGEANDAFRAIADHANVDRHTVKSFFSAALNRENYARARSDARVPEKFGQAIMEAFERLYPKVQLFSTGKPFGLIGMQLEGEILQIALKQLRLLDVFALPLHDAIAVNKKNQNLAKLAMEDAWEFVMRRYHPTAKTFVG